MLHSVSSVSLFQIDVEFVFVCPAEASGLRVAPSSLRSQLHKASVLLSKHEENPIHAQSKYFRPAFYGNQLIHCHLDCANRITNGYRYITTTTWDKASINERYDNV